MISNFDLILTRKVQPKPTEPISYFVEFEILDFINSDNRLFSGDCCEAPSASSPLSSVVASSHNCRNENKSCSVYWKLCISHLPPTELVLEPSSPSSDIQPSSSVEFNLNNQQVQDGLLSPTMYSYTTVDSADLKDSDALVSTTAPAQRGYKRNRALSFDWRLSMDNRATRRKYPSVIATRRPTESKSGSGKSSLSVKTSPSAQLSSSLSKPASSKPILFSGKLPPHKSHNKQSAPNSKGSTLSGITRPLVAATSSVAAAAGNAFPAALSTLSASAISSATQVTLRSLFSRLWTTTVKAIVGDQNTLASSGSGSGGRDDRPIIAIYPASSSSFVHLAKQGTATCSLAHWKTEPLLRPIQPEKPLRFYAQIPAPTIGRWLSGGENQTANQNDILSSRLDNVTEGFEHWQTLLLLLEAWHEDGQGDRLVARMLRPANATMHLPMRANFWQVGNWSTAVGSNNAGKPKRNTSVFVLMTKHVVFLKPSCTATF